MPEQAALVTWLQRHRIDSSLYLLQGDSYVAYEPNGSEEVAQRIADAAQTNAFVSSSRYPVNPEDALPKKGMQRTAGVVKGFGYFVKECADAAYGPWLVPVDSRCQEQLSQESDRIEDSGLSGSTDIAGAGNWRRLCR